MSNESLYEVLCRTLVQKDPCGDESCCLHQYTHYIVADIVAALDLPELLRKTKEGAWDEGFKQGGPMHDVNYDDQSAPATNPYRVERNEK